MIRSSESLMAEDVTIRCRVRRSQFATNPKFDEAKEMTCTMRNWETLTARGKANRSSSRAKVRPLSTLDDSINSNANNSVSSSATSRRIGCFDCGEGGPELLLTPIREILTNRDESPMRLSGGAGGGHLHNNTGAFPPDSNSLRGYSIPISDIMIVNNSSHKHAINPCQILITTFSCGLLDFQCVNRNGHDILMAFLKASLAPERILDGSRHHHLKQRNSNMGSSDSDGDCQQQQHYHNHHHHNHQRDGPTIRSSSSVTSCLDVDTLMAAHLQTRADSETWPEKMSRRVGKVVHSLSELTGAFCDIAWCLETSPTTPTSDDDADREKPPTTTPPAHLSASSPPHYNSNRRRMMNHNNHHSQVSRSANFHYYSDLEMDDQDSQIHTNKSIQLQQQSKKENAASTSNNNIHSHNSFERSWNSMPEARRYELARKSSC